MNKKLWTKNFTLIMIGTLISAVGGVGLNLALSVTIYDHTESTWLTGIYGAVTMVPTIILPILVSPIIDRYSRKNIIVRLDYMMGSLFIVFAFITSKVTFNYYFYMIIGLIITLNSVVYQLAYASLFPNLIPKGMMQKGYAIGNLIYPLTNVLILPVATFVFKHFGVSILFEIEGIFLLAAASFERMIDIEEVTHKVAFEVKSHINDIKEGFSYLFKEKGIWNVYLFFVVMMFADSFKLLIYPFFEQHPDLSLIQYSLLLSLQSAGYMFGGLLHYKIKVPTHLRYLLSLVVYLTFALFDAVFFFMPFFIMVLMKFMLGIIGMNSANIRVTSINAYIDDDKRGRLNAVFQTMVGMAMVLGKLFTGWLGASFSYEHIGIFYGLLVSIGVLVFIVRNQKAVKFLYNREV
ncbi:MFS transporter [Acidaminobacter sp. JC074]|uniref:MFS transporter n=1 Tax=Acidaminobacter sp. JC074 TaxID=2530199 RepID=UPI001F10583F|nr:MFS transporter [Acidaminobacter sp. JC074]MCH4887025.1 MFS transporter [Acidaminobacter sp. JC074]